MSQAPTRDSRAATVCKALILAAGQGSRLQPRGPSKPLVPLLGVPLIERVVRALDAAGVRELCVVNGHLGERVRRFLDDLAQRIRIEIRHVENTRWSRGNGLSVLAARECLAREQSFLLVMADHLFDRSIVAALLAHAPGQGEVVLAIDRRLDNPLVDPADATVVRSRGDQVLDIGKHLDEYDSFDTGLFYCTPALFDALAWSIETSGDDSLSAGIKRLAEQGRARVLDVSGQFWVDVDTPRAADQAERVLLEQLCNKSRDGPVSRYLNRPLSRAVSRRLARSSITPNQISCCSFLLCAVAAAVIAASAYRASPAASWSWLAAGGLLAFVASIVDGCDGEIARLKFLQSDRGAWLDAVLDRYADALLLFALLWRVYRAGDPLLSGWMAADAIPSLAVVTGVLAIVGAFMLSYTADKYDALMADAFARGTRFRLGRDVRILIVVVGVMLNLCFLVLLVHAVWMNAEVARRVWICGVARA